MLYKEEGNFLMYIKFRNDYKMKHSRARLNVGASAKRLKEEAL